MKLVAAESLLLVVDIQGALLPAIADGEAVLGHARWLLEVAALLEVPALLTEHCPERIGLTDARLRGFFPPERIVAKTWFSAVAEGGLAQAPGGERRQVVLSGMETHVCVQQTALDLLAAGREVFVVEEAVGSRRPRDKALALERLRQNGAEILSREMVAFEWLAHAGHPRFREVLRGYIR
ncbi:MAG: hypothetical protein RIR00_1742 [Pseudomonadota bacterium]|jgi:nicotinamidase-related amidase